MGLASSINNAAAALLRLLPAESAHDLGVLALRLGLVVPQRIAPDPALAQHLHGISFAHPLGLAAGFDKNALALPALAKLGFSLIEAGTVTPRAQPGNPRPRLFRLRADGALINRMGFNNEGSERVRKRLARLLGDSKRVERLHAKQAPDAPAPRHLPPIGINIGKNKASDTLELALADYEHGLRQLAPLCDYAVLNLSSPNTPGLRDLQVGKDFEALLERVGLVGEGIDLPPLFIKLAPDLSIDQACGIAERVQSAGLAGVILTNTTIQREGLRLQSKPALIHQAGGLSGKPLRPLANALTREVFKTTQGKLTIIGCGGIHNAESAWERLLSGASLLQLYSAFVLEGPGVVARIVEGLRERMAHHGVQSLSEVVGQEA